MFIGKRAGDSRFIICVGFTVHVMNSGYREFYFSNFFKEIYFMWTISMVKKIHKYFVTSKPLDFQRKRDISDFFCSMAVLSVGSLLKQFLWGTLNFNRWEEPILISSELVADCDSFIWRKNLHILLHYFLINQFS